MTPCTIGEANEYVRRFHRHNKPVQAALFAVQASDAAGIVRGVAIVGRPVARLLDVGQNGRMKRRVAEVVRVTSDGTRNVSSLLYGAVRRIAKEMGFERIITYSLEAEGGASLRASGWTCVGEAGGKQWNTPARSREIEALYDQRKYRWECVVNPPFPFETISWPVSLADALPFACHPVIPEETGAEGTF